MEDYEELLKYPKSNITFITKYYLLISLVKLIISGMNLNISMQLNLNVRSQLLTSFQTFFIRKSIDLLNLVEWTQEQSTIKWHLKLFPFSWIEDENPISSWKDPIKFLNLPKFLSQSQFYCNLNCTAFHYCRTWTRFTEIHFGN